MLKYFLCFFFLSIQIIAQTTYYVSSSQGNDSNNGTTQSSPWKTLNKVNNTNLNPGDQVLFRRTDTWTNQELIIDRSGNQNNLITFGAYGTGNKPIISGNSSLTRLVVIDLNVSYLTFDGIEFKDIAVTDGDYYGLVFMHQLANNITFDNCKFSQSARSQNQFAGMIFARDPHHLTIKNSEFTGGIAAINIISNYNNSHNDAHHITINNNWFHRISTRQNESDPTIGTHRSMAVWCLGWFNSSSTQTINGVLPGAYGTPGSVLGQEGTFRDITITNNDIDSLHNGGIIWYRNPTFYTSYPKTATSIEKPGYNWTITGNDINLTEGAGIELAPLSNRWGQPHPETGAPIGWSVIANNRIDSTGYNYMTGSEGLAFTQAHVACAIESHGWKQVYIENNHISWGSTWNGDGHGFNFDYSPTLDDGRVPCDSVVVRRNIIHDMWTNDWQRYTTGQSYEFSVAGIGIAASNVDNEIYDNVIYNSRMGIGLGTWSMGERWSTNIKVINNTIFGCNNGFVATSGNAWTINPNARVQNNIFAGNKINGWKGHTNITVPSAVKSNNLYWANANNYLMVSAGTNDVLGNPIFADTLNKDFRLLAGSGAINAGINVLLGLPFPRLRDTDLLGNLVPFNVLPDIGAYEFGSTGGSNSINANIKILLEGSFNSGSMTTTLLNNGHLPLSQPYNQAPWNYSGNESVPSIPSGVVDWVLLELRTETSSSSTVSSKAAFIKSNGFIVGLDGINPVSFGDLSAGVYYVVIKHRNHLSVMSSNAISLSSNSALYDFTTGPDKTFGNNSLSNLGNGNWGMYAGDGDINGLINVIDYGSVGNYLFQTGYNFGDLDLNGVINVMDYAKTNLNLFKNSQVPN